MDNSGNNSLPPSPEPSADVSASHVWSTTGHEEPERSNDHVVEESQPSPECSQLEDVNEISFSHHHHQKIERQDISNDADYSENRVSQATSTNMYDISEVKLSPGPSDLEPSSATHSHPSQYEDRLQMYHQQDEDFGEIPSTTTDPSHGELVDHDLKHYISHQEPSTSTMIMKSEPYDHQCVSDQDNHHHQHHHPHHHHHHQHHHFQQHHHHHHHLEPFSPHQPPASSTSGYEVAMESYGGVSPVTSYRNSPAPDNGEAVQPYNPGQAEGNAEVGNSTSATEVCVPVTVSSSEVISSAHLVQDSSQKDILAVETGGEKFTSSMEDVETIHEPTESHQTSSPHPLDPPISQDEISALSLHQRDESTMNAVRYYNSESLDPALAHLVNQRFSSLIAPSLVSLPASKEFFVESVMRNMIGGQSSRLYSADGVLSEEDSARLVEDPDGSLHIKEMVASSMANEVLSVDRTFPVVSMSGTLQVEPSSLSGNILDERGLVSLPSGSQVATVLSDSLPPGLLAISPGGILVERNIVEHHLSTTESPHHSQDAINSIVSSMSGMPNLITTTTVIHDREVSSVDSLVQVSHVSASPIQSYVSSSTNGHDDGTHNLADHTIILDNTVDSTVGTSDSHLQHSKGMVGSTNEHYPTEMDHQEAVALKYSTGMDVDQYTAVVTTHDENLDSGQGVSTTREDVDQTTGIILLSSDVPSTTTLGVPLPLSESIDSTLTSSSIASESLMSATSIPDNQQTLALSRPRRNLTKQRMQVAKNSEGFEHLWCEECGMCYDNGCPKHRVQTIFDKPVLTRAWASLPVSYLSISKIATLNEGEAVYGVFAKKCITKRTQFGPLEGVPVKQEEPFSEHQGLVLQIETESGELVNLNTGDESLSNWMRFVRQADDYREQNLVVVQHGQSLYYTTVRNIMPRTELKVGYSIQYACRRGLAVLEPDEEMRAEEEQENSWPCFECNKRFPNSEGLQQHLNEHDVVDMANNVEKNEEVEEESLAARKRGRPKGKSSKKSKARITTKKSKPTGSSSPQEEFICQLCSKVFPRQYSLQRHLAMHSGEKKFTCPICQKKFTHMYNRNRHMRRHRTSTAPESETIKKPVKSLFKKKQAGGCEWVCTHCDLTFDNASLLNLHTLTHAAEDVAYQDFTRFHVEPSSNSKDEELGEVGFENGDMMQNEILQCPQCTQEFHTRRELIDHASTHGKVVTRKSFRGIINPAKPYKCELCYKSFATEDRLQRHMLVHGNEEAKPLQCGVCEKRFLNNSALACHIKVHSDEKKCYECPICKEEFDQIVSLKEHIRIHSINGLFTCPSCQKTFDEYNQIRKHIRAFHSEKKFPCEHCDKIFPRPDKLKLHMLRHSSHREFLCANCGKQFKRKDKLKEHMKRMHSAEREARLANKPTKTPSSKKFIPKVSPTDYHRFIYKCHACLLGFKRRGMLVNHLAKRHPDIRPESVPELNLPILKTTRDYYCQYCEKVYKSSSKRKAHILKQHPGAELPMSNRRKGGIPEIPGMPNPTFSQTVGSITTHPHNCEWCHKQYASKAKLLQHQRKKHLELLPQAQQVPRTHLREHSGQVQQQYIALPTSIMHQQITATTQTSEMEFDDTVIIADIKPKLVTTIGGPTTSIYMGRDEDGSSTVVVSASDLVSQPATVEGLQPADLLTQAMSELTQSLTDYQPATHEYELARVTHSCPPAVVVPSPESTPIHQPSSTPTHITIEQSQLGRLLGHYEGSETQDSPVPPPPPPPLSDSPQPIVITTDSSTFVPRTWAETYTDYPAR